MKNNIKYKIINFNNLYDSYLFYKFYYKIYIKEFTNKNERESISNIKKQYNKNKKLKNVFYYCILLIVDNKICGGIIGNYHTKSNSSIIEYIVINSKDKNKGYGTTLLNKFISICNDKSKEINNKSFINYCLFEMEKDNNKRIDFWDKNKGKILDFKYIQPPLSNNKNIENNLNLCIIPINYNKNYIESSILLGILIEYFTYSFSNKNINIFKQIKNSLSNKTISFKNIK